MGHIRDIEWLTEENDMTIEGWRPDEDEPRERHWLLVLIDWVRARFR